MSRPSDSPTIAAPELKLAPRQDLGSAAGLQDWFLARQGDAAIDASEVEVLTTPVLQVLIAGGDHLRGRGWHLAVKRPSPAFLACVAELGTGLARLTDGPADRGTA